MNVVAIIQARTGSTRLPGKVLKDLFGKSVLEHVIERVASASCVNTICVATTSAPSDDPIVEIASSCGVSSYRGSEQDVLGRYLGAAKTEKADIVVRITSDCPLIDPDLLDQLVATFLTPRERPLDYLSNTLQRTYPRGLDAEVFTFRALEQANNEAARPYEREHVTPYIHQRPDRFQLLGLTGEADLSHHRWTLDTPEDFEFIHAVYAKLYTTGSMFKTQDILNLIAERPEIAQINAHIEQKPLG